MPYSSNQELPKGVKENLPSEAQSTWRKIFNSAFEQYHADDKAAATAWAGIKRAGWKQDKEGNWHKTVKKAVEDDLLKMFLPITKVDETTRTIYLTAASEARDKAGEILDYERSKPYFQKWSADMYQRSGGKSYGNIREMHTSIAAGKILDPISYDDVAKRIDIAVKVIDDNTWRKVDEGVLTGASIGGKYVERNYSARDNAYKYVADISEISLVDNPCNPDAVFQLVKSDGSVELKKFKRVIDGNENLLYNGESDNMTKKVSEREDVSPAARERAKEEYGDVKFADEKNKKYPLDSEKHVRAAASYFGMPKNRAKYSAEDQKKIQAAINRAKAKFGIGEQKTKKCEDGTMAHKAVHKAAVHKAHEAHKVKKDAVTDPAIFKDKGTLEFIEVIPADLAALANMLEQMEEATEAHDSASEEKSEFYVAKAGKTYSGKTLKALKALSHGVGQMGGHCDCEDCKSAYKGFFGIPDKKVKKADGTAHKAVHKAMKNDDDEEMECAHKAKKAVHKADGTAHKAVHKAAADGAHKAHKAVHKTTPTPEQPKQPDSDYKLGKNAGGDLKKFTDELTKRFDALKAENEELRKSVKKLEDMPANGGPVLNAQAVAVQKGFAGQEGNPAQYGLNETEAKINALKALRDGTNDMVMKDAIGRQLANLEMQKAHQNPINFTPKK